MGYDRKNKTKRKHTNYDEDDKIGNHLHHKKNVSSRKKNTRSSKIIKSV